ncbi:hypothetical protein [Jidongwangia harbinensis]|uniref:hypothetical protein n=1 Tax=Jidongwangia harbinensis TaxID=2878561 RepID=UPI001CDA02BB|nr:hypothetical protein [Jidongwangia harbinensis]MCA2213375.1 hypothetical protein [Jidongwangia harbinensis]
MHAKLDRSEFARQLRDSIVGRPGPYQGMEIPLFWSEGGSRSNMGAVYLDARVSPEDRALEAIHEMAHVQSFRRGATADLVRENRPGLPPDAFVHIHIADEARSIMAEATYLWDADPGRLDTHWAYPKLIAELKAKPNAKELLEQRDVFKAEAFKWAWRNLYEAGWVAGATGETYPQQAWTHFHKVHGMAVPPLPPALRTAPPIPDYVIAPPAAKSPNALSLDEALSRHIARAMGLPPAPVPRALTTAAWGGSGRADDVDLGRLAARLDGVNLGRNTRADDGNYSKRWMTDRFTTKRGGPRA